MAHFLRAVGGGDGVLLVASAGPNFLLEALTEYVCDGVIWRAIPGQERGNAYWTQEHGLTCYCRGSVKKTIKEVLQRLTKINTTDKSEYPQNLLSTRADMIEQAQIKLIEALQTFLSGERKLAGGLSSS